MAKVDSESAVGKTGSRDCAYAGLYQRHHIGRRQRNRYGTKTVQIQKLALRQEWIERQLFGRTRSMETALRNKWISRQGIYSTCRVDPKMTLRQEWIQIQHRGKSRSRDCAYSFLNLIRDSTKAGDSETETVRRSHNSAEAEEQNRIEQLYFSSTKIDIRLLCAGLYIRQGIYTVRGIANALERQGISVDLVCM